MFQKDPFDIFSDLPVVVVHRTQFIEKHVYGTEDKFFQISADDIV